MRYVFSNSDWRECRENAGPGFLHAPTLMSSHNSRETPKDIPKEETKSKEGTGAAQHEVRDSKGQSNSDIWWVPLTAGTLSGVALACIFNPYDRALYLSVINEKPFLHRANWTKPFQGAANALFHRTIAGGLYFAAYDALQAPVEYIVSRYTNANLSDSTNPSEDLRAPFLTGTLAGFVNGVVLNPIAAVKYAAWGSDTSKGLQKYAISLWHKGRVRPFIAGIVPTVIRDMVFGASYSTLRYTFANSLSRRFPASDAKSPEELNGVHSTKVSSLVNPISQFTGAAIATTLSSPFNYWRNMQFATVPGKRPIDFFSCMRMLGITVNEAPGIRAKCLKVSMRFRIGWGTIRVATGMAVGQTLYDYFALKIKP